MANIPLANIPNAPSAMGQSPMAPAGAVRMPRYQQMPVLDRGVFDGVGAGAVALSRGAWQGAQVIGDFAQKMASANDDFQYAAADRAFSEAISSHEVETANMPPDKHLQVWESKYLPKLQEQVGSMRVTPEGRARIDAFFQRQAGNATAAIRVGAHKKFLEAGLQESDNYIDRAINEGRDEDALGQLARDVTNGVRSKEDAEAREIKIMEDRKVSTMTEAIQQNPAYWRKEFRKYLKEGKNPHNLRPEQSLQFYRMSEGAHAQLVDDLTNEMLTRLETESAAITNEQIEEFYTRPDIDAPRELINKMKEYRDFKYADTPEGQAEKNTRYSDLWQAIFNYDAAKDISMADPDTHKREYQKLQQQIIESAPEGERKPFLDTLNDMVTKANQGSKSRADHISRGLVNITADLAKWGQLGAVVEYRKEKRGDVEVNVPKDPQAQLAVETKRLEITNDIQRMMRENPDLTEEQAMERFKGILENRLDGGALFMQQPDEDSWWDTLGDIITWGGIVMNPTANNPNVMTAGFNFPSGKAPASIRHNNAGAMWYRANSWQSKFGATFGQKLNDGLGQGNQIASFPTPVHGAAALLYQLNRPSYVGKTVREAISKWSGGNSVGSYLSVLRGAGFSADQRVADIMADPQSAVAFAKAMARHEAGVEYPMSDDQWQQAYNMFRQA